jgi:hypothetical protein
MFGSFLVVAATGAPGDGGESVVAIGKHGDLRRLTVRGATTFGEAAIKDALRWDFDTLLATHPSAPVAEFAETLSRKIGAGYRNAGFLEASVSIRLNSESGQMEAEVREGPRYTAGDVQIEGATTIPVARLVKRLSTRYAPKDALPSSVAQCVGEGEAIIRWSAPGGNEVGLESPVWEPAKPARFPTPSKIDARRSFLDREVADALADVGYYFSTFSVQVAADPATKTAKLVVKIIDEGPRAAVGRIEIDGNNVNSREEILACLQVKPGEALDYEDFAAMYRRLWQSGRFVESRLSLLRPVAADDACVLRVSVIEYGKAPPLSKPLSREEQTLLKLRDWLADGKRWQGDLRVEAFAPEVDFSLVLSPTDGVVISAKSRASSEEKLLVDHALLASRDEIGFYARGLRRKLAGKPIAADLIASCEVTLVEQPDDQERPWRSNLKLGLGMRSADDAAARIPFRLSLTMAPCAFLAMASDGDVKCTFDGGTMCLTRDNQDWRIDAESGRLLEVVIHPEKDLPAEEKEGGGEPARPEQTGMSAEGDAAADLPDPCARITFEPGLFARRRKETLAAAAAYANDYDARRPVSSVLSFLCDEPYVWRLVSSDEKYQRAWRIARLAIEKRILQPIDDLCASAEAPRETFRIPPATSEQEAAKNFASLAWFGRMAAVVGDNVFVRGSWPWTVTREAGLVLAGKGQHAEAEAGRLLESPTTGPICCLAIATIAEGANPRAAAPFAKLGLERLTVERFRDDHRPWLDRSGLVGQCVERAADVFRDLEEADVEALAAALPPEYLPYFQECQRFLRWQRDKPLDTALPELLDALWQAGLRDRVKALLEQIEQRQTPQDRQNKGVI